MLALAALAYAQPAFAADLSLQLRLPHCPSTLRLNLAPELGGFSDDNAIAAQLNSNEALKGQYVASIEFPGERFLLVSELASIVAYQGQVDKEMLSQLEAAQRETLNTLTPEASAYSKALSRGDPLSKVVTSKDQIEFDVIKMRDGYSVEGVGGVSFKGNSTVTMFTSRFFVLDKGCLVRGEFYVPLTSNVSYENIKSMLAGMTFD